jgi:hypothetical protein
MISAGGSSANRSVASCASHFGHIFRRAATPKNFSDRVTEVFNLHWILRPSENLTRQK